MLPAHHRLHVGLCPGLPPAVAGGLAAWLRASGHALEVRRGGWGAGGALWVALEAPVDLERLRDLGEARLFGPALADPSVRRRLRAALPGCRLIEGDPRGIDDPSALPRTTWAGFDLPSGGPRRILAGLGDRPRPLGEILGEIVYLVESQGAGLLLFDDEDLGRHPGWPDLQDELRRLPWPLRWEGTVGGARIARGRVG